MTFRTFFTSVAGVAVAVTAAASLGLAPTASAHVQVGGDDALARSEAAGQAAFDAAMREVLAQKLHDAGVTRLEDLKGPVTVTFADAQAPKSKPTIKKAADLWNKKVKNVQFKESSGRGDFYFKEGIENGSHANTDGKGHGYVFVDLKQTKQYYDLRVITHEMGHVLGLSDHYSGPCSELMSGHGPGTKCRNPYPNAAEVRQVEDHWSHGVGRA